MSNKFPPDDPRNKLVFFYDDSSQHVEYFLKKFKEIARVEEISISQLALYWSLTRPWMDTVLVGSRNREQIEDNIAAFNIDPGSEVILKITALSDELLANMPMRDNIFNHDPSGRS